jgi:hypothetical protein
VLGKWILFAWFACVGAYAQDTQALPEIDVHLTFNSHVRAYVQAKDDREGGDPEQFTFGPSVQIFHKPWLKLKDVTAFDFDDVKSRPFVFESGYRSITAPDKPPENRAIEALTFHLPPGRRLVLFDRNRVDLDWQSGQFTWRYRNKLTLQRTFRVSRYHFHPYLAAEPFYESQYGKWSATDLFVGSLWPVGKHVQFDTYYEHENDTSKQPNRQKNYVGLVLHLYFSLRNEAQSPAPPRPNRKP